MMSLATATDKRSRCYSYIGLLLMQMNEQGVNDVSNINQTLGTSFNSSIPIVSQIKSELDSIDPVIYRVYIRSFSNSYELGIAELVYVKNYVKNRTVFIIII